MLPFTQLFRALDESNRTADKVAALERYFREAPAEDAAWGLWFLLGNKVSGVARGRALLESAAVLAGLPMWLVEESYATVGDLAETLSLIVDCPGRGNGMPLHTLVEEHLLPLREAGDAARIERIHGLWMQMDQPQCLVLNKLLTGAFRVGASRTLVLRALAQVAGVDAAVMSHRIMGTWQPTAAQYRRFLSADELERDPAQPYPFYLASPLEGLPERLGDITEWQAEWKWDGIRCQLIRRQGNVLLWSRGEELIGDAFPELVTAAARLPDGTVLDGEVLAWSGGRPLPFAALQKRLGRKQASRDIQRNTPAVFMAYDCLEHHGIDVREQPLQQRRGALEVIIDKLEVIMTGGGGPGAEGGLGAGGSRADQPPGEAGDAVGGSPEDNRSTGTEEWTHGNAREPHNLTAQGTLEQTDLFAAAEQDPGSPSSPAAAHHTPTSPFSTNPLVSGSPPGLINYSLSIITSPLVAAADWQELAGLWSGARKRGVEGLMLKRRDSPYRAGRMKGDWWKWKVEPLSVDAVVIYAQSGHGKRANLFSDYTFAVWDGGELVPVAKAYSGLSDDELRQVDSWVKRHSLAKHGPVRIVPPELVMEIGFEGIQESTRHRSGIALRFPRILRWRRDKKPADADSLDSLRALLR